ncbi:MAG: hypothetical protein U0556_12535 [Dehalococcoidia bacterium]
MNPLPLVLIAPFALLLPGLSLVILLRLPVAKPDGRPDAGELVALSLVLSVAFNAWLALTLAEFGRFGLLGLALVWTVLGLAAAVRTLRSGWPVGLPQLDRWSIAFGAILVLAAFLLHRPAEYVFGVYDPGVYVNLGASIARSGSVLVADPELSRLSSDERSALFGNVPAPWHRSGMPFLTVHDSTSLEPEWFHLFPGWLAIWALAGNPLWGPPSLALIAIAAIYLVGRLLVHPAVGVGAAMLLTVNPGEIWFGRYPMSEILAQAVVLGGIALLAFAAVHRSARFSALAGATLGLVHLAKIDVLIVPVGLAGALAYQWIRREWGPRETALLSGYLLICAQAVVHALLFARFYTLRIALDLLTIARLRPFVDLSALGSADLAEPYSLGQIGRLAVANWWLALPALVTALLAFLALVALRRIGRRLTVPVSSRLNLALVMIVTMVGFWAFFIRPVSAGSPLPAEPAARAIAVANRESFLQLGWYLTPLGLMVAIGGVVGIFISRPGKVLALFAFCGTLTGLLLLNQGLINPVHFWAFRRYLPLLLPLLCLGAAFLLFSIGGRSGSWRAHLVGLGLGLLLVSMQLRLALPILSETEYGGARAQLQTIAAGLPPDAVLLFQWGDAAQRLATPLALTYGRTVFAVEPPTLGDPGLASAIRRWSAEGRPVIYLAEPGASVVPLGANPLGQVGIDVPALESTPDRLPSEWGRLRFTLDTYRVGK